MPHLPDGTVTFLFTDIEGSTRMWEAHPDQMRPALARHDTLLRGAINGNNGVVFKTMGDAFFAVFATATDALGAMLAAQIALHAEPWPDGARIRARMALHTGAAELRDQDYFGPPLNRAARLLTAGHGGQALVSMVTQELVRDTLPPDCLLHSLGEHRLRDLSRAETIFQLQHPALPALFPELRSLDVAGAPNNNLPQQLTSFIGMEKAMSEVKSLLAKTRLLTLLGTGGCGKTRLSLQVAADVIDSYPDGVWLVELGAISDAALVAQSTAQALGVKEQAGTPLTQTLIAHLKSRNILVLLDNCEHLLAACAQFASSLTRACPQVSLLATSREPLNTAGEQTFRVPSLSMPTLAASGRKQTFVLEEMPRYEAVQLFSARAALVKADYQVTAQNAPSLIQLCHRLDGIPLALELAAARTRSLPVEEINRRLHQRFRLLKGGDRAAPSRQQTLQAAIDWSYALLNAQEQSLLYRLSAFAGGWTLDAAHAVAGDEDMEEWEVLDLLSSLVDKSLVVYEEAEGEQSAGGRYRLLESIRQYCCERLAEQGQEAALLLRHRNYFLERAEEAEANLRGMEQTRWLRYLEAEHDNLRAAQSSATDDTTRLRFVSALWRFWYIRGYLSEGRTWTDGVLEQTDSAPTLLRARVLYGAGVLAGYQGEQAVAQALLEQSLALSRLLSDPGGMADALNIMGILAMRQGEYARSRGLYEESLALYRATNDPEGAARSLTNLGIIACYEDDYAAAHVFYNEVALLHRESGNKLGLATMLHNLGWLAQRQQDYDQARALNTESIELKREIGNKEGIAVSVLNLADIGRIQQDYAAMWPLLAECLMLFEELGDQQYVAFALEVGAAALAAQGEARSATRLFGFADKLRQASAAPMPPEDTAEYNARLAAARDTLGDAGYQAAWEQGQVMTMEEAAACVLENVTASRRV